ncbi:type II toxin-antitoxin system Phd/YefM family antitoxin [Nocardiopsis composta]|uniref:Antitoxin n=1 Tax=Nocardiopsis composta TaxID=157465 RepID=A0A7W8QRC7_9ACTN|nr:type II toxin-antitoxin system Phd/YefM family antitoxin [Nocardiopsis composta]MBB5435016.1 prevent-host-death family protein [Nocardiopsis composta]
MANLSLTEARNRLSELVDEVENTHERVVITRHGREAAILISPDDLAMLEETLEVLASPELMRQLAESKKDIESGKVLDAEGVAALMAERKTPQ